MENGVVLKMDPPKALMYPSVTAGVDDPSRDGGSHFAVCPLAGKVKSKALVFSLFDP
jgi:hypothetical protein